MACKATVKFYSKSLVIRSGKAHTYTVRENDDGQFTVKHYIERDLQVARVVPTMSQAASLVVQELAQVPVVFAGKLELNQAAPIMMGAVGAYGVAK